MSLFSSSSRSSSSGGSSPTAPPAVTSGITDFTALINSLGNRNPQQYVSGPSYLQNQAFSMGSRIGSRYGANVTGGAPGGQAMGFGAPVGIGGGAFQAGPGQAGPLTASGGGGTLYDQSGVNPEGTVDWSAYGTQLGMQNYINSLDENGLRNISRGWGDGSGNDVSIEMAARAHADRYGLNDNAPRIGGGQPAGGGSPTQSWAQPGFGYTMADDTGLNPVAGFRDAANMTRGVGSGGANLADVFTMDERIDMGPASAGAARRGIEFSKDYENEYTDNVVNTTMANFDEHAGRTRAAEAAQAAGNNAFGGSRFAVQRAITEEQIARERASQEAGLRFNAQDRAFGFGSQDADRHTSTSIANAQMANQRAEAQAGMDFNRLLANMGAQNDNSRFNAGQEDTADARSLAAAGQLSDISNTAAGNERADLAAIAGLGDREREIDQQSRTADLRLMELMAQLYGMTPLDVVTGQRNHNTASGTHNPSTIDNIGSVLDIGGRVASIFG